MSRTLRTIGITLALITLGLASGCDYTISPKETNQIYKQKESSKIESSYFDDWGLISVLQDCERGEIELGDLDGDGDLDIVLFMSHKYSTTGALKIYKNRINEKYK